ncbi:MAG TPA: Os1348 family NHLP clan protein [Vicinamibacterales bacterium]|nr:Os1348 family NHLP clan protein [Vicinamibacterales bacterium]
MAQKTVQSIIGQLLTDEELRTSFLERPAETLEALREKGVDLTRAEADAIARTDLRLWRWGVQWLDSRLQRCRLSASERE